MRLLSASFFAALLLGVLGVALFGSVEAPSSSPSAQTPRDVQPVNAVLGNESYRRVFGHAPTPQTPERLRLQTHLAVVESLLRERDVSHLTPSQQKRRAKRLDALHNYWTDGRFPRNTEVPGRTPVFIDAEGRLCAVAHLIAESAGRDLAESIDEQHHLAHIRDIDRAALDRWAEQHGFTRRELAMIQPQYCYIEPCPPPGSHESESETASALEITALSTSVGASLLNGVLLERGSPSIVGGAAGVAGGATSFTIGMTDGAKYPTASAIAGATSVALGTWSLIAAFRGDEASEPSPPPASAQKEKDWSWQLAPTTLTTIEGTMQPGVTATLRF